jgi:hypothetical protein
MQGLRAAEEVFGAEPNSHGYKVIRGAGVIQGDGISIHTLADIAAAVKEAGYSPESVAYGMGGGLLQKVGAQGARRGCGVRWGHGRHGGGGKGGGGRARPPRACRPAPLFIPLHFPRCR